MDLINTYGEESNNGVGKFENNLLIDLEMYTNKFQTSNFCHLDSFIEQCHPNLVGHKNYLSKLEGGKIHCLVCSVNMDSILELPEHLQKKSHEDSIIKSIQENMPFSLFKSMEFVTFYDSNLYCNLCKTNISWSSENLYRTIVQIIAHNESNDHLGKKVIPVKPPVQNTNDPITILQSLASLDSLLSENLHFIDFKVQPSFHCKLCSKPIEFEENQTQLLINFSLHLNSEGHKKCFKTYSILKSFKEANSSKITPNHSFTVAKDRIACSCSKRSINPSLESLLEHVGTYAEGDLSNFSLNSEVSNLTLDGSKYCGKSVSVAPAITDFSEMFNKDIVASTFIKSPIEAIEESNLIHGHPPLNFNTESSDNMVQEKRSLMIPNSYVNNEGESGCYSALKELESKDFFVNKVSKFLAKNTSQVMCDVCDAIICCSSDENLLKNSIKSHFIDEQHKNFLEKLTFDEKENIVKLIFEDAHIQANKQYIKASGKYIHCILCQYSVNLCLDYESLQKKLVTHCLGKNHIMEIKKPYNSVFGKNTMSPQSTASNCEDSADKPPGSDFNGQSKNSYSDAFSGHSGGDSSSHRSDTPSVQTVDKMSLKGDPNAIKILNLLTETTLPGLMGLMKAFGPLRHCYLSKDNGMSKRFALVHFRSRQSAEKALSSLNGLQTKYGVLTVKWAY